MAAESTLIDHLSTPQLLARYDHGGFDFRMHGSYAFVGRRRDAARTPVFVVAVKQSIYRWAFFGSDLCLLNGRLGLSPFWLSCGISRSRLDPSAHAYTHAGSPWSRRTTVTATVTATVTRTVTRSSRRRRRGRRRSRRSSSRSRSNWAAAPGPGTGWRGKGPSACLAAWRGQGTTTSGTTSWA